jgi:hypothetical protein
MRGHVFYKTIFCDKFDSFWTTTLLMKVFSLLTLAFNTLFFFCRRYENANDNPDDKAAELTKDLDKFDMVSVL